MAIIARLVVGPHEPHQRIVEACLMDVEHRDRDAQPRAGTAVRLFEVGTPGLLEALDAAGRVGQADFGKYAARGSSSKSGEISPTRGSGCITIISFLAAFIISGSITYAPLTSS